MSFRNPFAPRRPVGTSNRAALVKNWVRDHAGFGDDVAIAITEIACRHAACGGAETLVMIDVATSDLRVLRFDRALAEISVEDVRQAIEAAGGCSPD